MTANSYQKKMDICLDNFRRYLQKLNYLPNEAIDAVVSLGIPGKYKKGDFFSKQGELSNKMAFICSGIFNVYSTQEDGALFVVSFMKEDDFIQGSFDISAPSNVTIQALCDTIVIEYPTNVMHDMYLQYPHLGSFARCLMEKYFVVYAAHMIQIGTKNALGNYLLFRNNFRRYEERIPKQLIAAYLGITPTQLSRVRKKIASEKQATKSNTQ
jgi:CRP-like cAMP-binding protein